MMMMMMMMTYQSHQVGAFQPFVKKNGFLTLFELQGLEPSNNLENV